MATYKQVGYGSQGSDVKNLQQILNKNGYNLSVDGIFGSNTQAAVKDYQKKNNLAVDGIVGTNTWGALYNGFPGFNGNTSTTTKNNQTGFQYDPYTESDVVKQAYTQLQQQLANKPGEYQSAWQAQLNDVINKIMNREQFTYDVNGDALYQQYKDLYTQQGQMAMMDTMGQAATLTGGYGNSYAQTVGQQVYQGYMQELNSKIPELYQIALNKYQMEGDDLYNQYSLLGTQEQQDYGRYRDTVSDWNTELDRLQSQYNAERDYDYGKWADNRDFGYGQYVDDRNYNYQVQRDKVLDAQWQAEFNEAVRQFQLQWDAEHPDTTAAAGGGGGGSSGGYRSSGGSGGSDGGSGGGTNLDAAINALVRGSDDAGNVYTTSTANKHTATGQQQIKSAVNDAIDAAVKDGTITAKEAAAKKASLRGQVM